MLKISFFSVFSFFICFSSQMFSQANSNDFQRLKLSPIILPQASSIPNEAHSLLINKMNQIVSANGMTSNLNSSRFIITPNVAVLNKEIIGGAPILYSLKLEVTFYIGDAISGSKFSTASVEVIGTGTSENKALIQAFNKIKTDDEKIVKALSIGKSKIIDYYAQNCDIIIRQAASLAYNRNYDEAIFNLISIPDASNTCFNKALDAIKPIFKEKIDYECAVYLNKAENSWNSNQSYSGADEAGKYLSKIDPLSSCYNDAKALRDNINKRIIEIDKREWNYKWESEIGVTKDLIKAYRDIGVAWGENQPETILTTYNIIWW
jgi:hypothetical protein